MSVWNSLRDWQRRHPDLSVAAYSVAAFVILGAAALTVGFAIWVVGLAVEALAQRGS